MTQIRVVGSIGISELFMFVLAPIMFMQDVANLRKDGFMPIVWLSLLTCASCIISSIVNETSWPFVLRGIASPYSLFAITVVLHRLLSKNLNGLRWVMLGWALSQVINIFIFQRGVEVHNVANGFYEGVEAAEIMSSPIFWIGRLGPWISLPITGWYLKTPMAYTLIEPLAFAIFALFSTESGRAGALCCVGSFVLLAMARKNIKRIQSISKNLFVIFTIGALAVFLFTVFYKHAATTGALGEKALVKYELQTKGKQDFMALIMGGRSEFFIGLMAALRHPIWGYGPWPVDKDGIGDEFLAKYGDHEDYSKRMMARLRALEMGYSTGSPFIPTHSHIVGGWVWYGVIGGILWVYFLYRIFYFLKHDAAAIPGWYGYFAVMLPQCTWDILFSPFGARLTMALLITCLLLASAAREGKVSVCRELLPVNG